MIKVFRFCLLLVWISGMCLIPMMSVLANTDNGDENDIAISLSPQDTLFNVSNMKPGDWAPRILTVMNSGNKDFVYHMKVQNSGDEKLFNELLLEINAGDQELYQGKLSTFSSNLIEGRELESGMTEDLEITIRFPEHLGNEFQGLKTTFVIQFTAEGKNSASIQAMTIGQIDSGSNGPTSAGSLLPNTSTNIFNLMLLGSVLMAGGIALIVIRHYRRMKLIE